MKLSDRLELIASFVPDHAVLADIGTDHAFLPVKLVLEKRIEKAFAMDIGTGPLERAVEHISAYSLTDCIETRLSDGLTALKPGEVDTILIAGMGGDLILKILKAAKDTVNEADLSFSATLKHLILSPHTEWDGIRKAMRHSSFFTEKEAMLNEDGRYYTVMRFVPKSSGAADPYEKGLEQGLSEAVMEQFGPLLLLEKDPVLKAYLKREQIKTEAIIAGFREDSERQRERKAELSDYLALIREAENYIEH